MNENINSEVLSKLNIYLESLITEWDKQYPNKKSWLTFRETYLVNSTIFLINVLDDLIVFVQETVPVGADRKVAVLAIISKVFDHIVIQAVPAWLNPFIPIIKQIVIGIIINQLIEYIVSKYKSGAWNLERTDPNGT